MIEPVHYNSNDLKSEDRTKSLISAISEQMNAIARDRRLDQESFGYVNVVVAIDITAGTGEVLIADGGRD